MYTWYYKSCLLLSSFCITLFVLYTYICYVEKITFRAAEKSFISIDEYINKLHSEKKNDDCLYN